MKSVMAIYGTRPEAIKMAPLILELSGHPQLSPIVAVTGQHREMLDQVNELFDIRPDHDMNLMSHGSSLTDLTAKAVSVTGSLLASERPDVVVVQGDTTSAFAASLAAFLNHIPVVHLEAGLRTGNLRSPFPEEANRTLTARVTELHLAPTSTSKDNLLREGIAAQSVAITGNTVIDALQRAASVDREFETPSLNSVVGGERRILLVTAHRRESWGDRMRESMTAIRQLAQDNTDMQVVLPMHRNSQVRGVVESVLGGLPNVLLTDVLSYFDFAKLLSAAHVVLTDSGGVQEEAPSLGKPVLVMRDTTERPEAVQAGTVKLVGTDASSISRSVSKLWGDEHAYRSMANAVNPYGDGKASERSAAAIAQLLNVGQRLPDFSASSADDLLARVDDLI